MNQCYTAYQLLFIGMLIALLSSALETLFRPKIMGWICRSGRKIMITNHGRKRNALPEAETIPEGHTKKIMNETKDESILNMSKDELYQKVIEQDKKINQITHSINTLRQQNLILMVKNASYKKINRKSSFDS